MNTADKLINMNKKVEDANSFCARGASNSVLNIIYYIVIQLINIRIGSWTERNFQNDLSESFNFASPTNFIIVRLSFSC